jgi:hypothetical protein
MGAVDMVTVRFAGGPADGTARELPATPDGGPPRRWVLSSRDEATGAPGEDHLYELSPERSATGAWTMAYVRSDRLGMSE